MVVAPSPLPIAPLVDRLRDRLAPLQVWLIGSRARGDHRPGSDWDLIAVLPDDAPASAFDPVEAWKLLRPDEFGAEVIVYPQREFLEDRTTPNTIPFSVAREGRLLHER